MKIEIKPNDQSWVGKKIRRLSFQEDYSLVVTAVGNTRLLAIDTDGYELAISILGPWELYDEPQEIPANQRWVVPGVKCARLHWLSAHYFTPTRFNFALGMWEGEQSVFVKCSTTMYCMDESFLWRVCQEPKPKLKWARALIETYEGYYLTQNLYKSKIEADANNKIAAIEGRLLWPAPKEDAEGFIEVEE
jgi:hypothetical protein